MAEADWTVLEGRPSGRALAASLWVGSGECTSGSLSLRRHGNDPTRHERSDGDRRPFTLSRCGDADQNAKMLWPCAIQRSRDRLMSIAYTARAEGINETNWSMFLELLAVLLSSLKQESGVCRWLD